MRLLPSSPLLLRDELLPQKKGTGGGLTPYSRVQSKYMNGIPIHFLTHEERDGWSCLLIKTSPPDSTYTEEGGGDIPTPSLSLQ